MQATLLVCCALLGRAGGEKDAFGARQGDLRGLVDHGGSAAAAATEPAARAPLLPLLAAHSPYDVSNIAFQRFDRSWKALPTGADGQRVSFLRGTDEMEDPRMFVSRQGVRMLILQRMDKEIWVGPLADTAQGGHVTLEGLDSGSLTNNVHKNWAPLSEDDGAVAASGGSDAAEPDSFRAVICWDPLVVAQCAAHRTRGWRNTTCSIIHKQANPVYRNKSPWNYFSLLNSLRGGSQLIPVPPGPLGGGGAASGKKRLWLGFTHSRFEAGVEADATFPARSPGCPHTVARTECQCVHAAHMVVLEEDAGQPVPTFSLVGVRAPMHFYHDRVAQAKQVRPLSRSHDTVIDPTSIVSFDAAADTLSLSLNVGDMRLLVVSVRGAFKLANAARSAPPPPTRVGHWEDVLRKHGVKMWQLWVDGCRMEESPLLAARQTAAVPAGYDAGLDAKIVAELTPLRADVPMSRRFMFPSVKWEAEHGWYDAVYRVDTKRRRRRRRRAQTKTLAH